MSAYRCSDYNMTLLAIRMFSLVYCDSGQFSWILPLVLFTGLDRGKPSSLEPTLDFAERNIFVSTALIALNNSESKPASI